VTEMPKHVSIEGANDTSPWIFGWF
jgi:hypothetical protein